MRTIIALVTLIALLVYLSGTFVDYARFELSGTMDRIERNTGGN